MSPSSLTQFLSLSSVWEYRKYTTIKDQREKSEIARLLTSIADITAVYISENTSGKYCLIAGQGGTLIKQLLQRMGKQIAYMISSLSHLGILESSFMLIIFN